MKKFLFNLLFIVLLFNNKTIAQTTPVFYYTFDETNPLAPTVGSTNLTGGGTYQILTSGQVSKYITWRNNLGALMSGQALSATNNVTVQFLLKKNYFFDDSRNGRIFVLGSMNVSMADDKLYFGSGSSTSEMVFDGINRKSLDYLADGNWHHFAFVHSTTVRQIWLDGQKIYEQNISSASISGNLFLTSNTDYDKAKMDIDEIAVYNVALTPNQIYKNYLDAQSGNHYTTALSGSVPSTQNLVGTLDTMEFAPTPLVTPLTQLKNYPIVRYKRNHTLLRNVNWMDPKFMAGLFQSGITNTMIADTSTAMSIELVRNYNYYFDLKLDNQPWTTKWISTLNADLTLPISIITLRAQINLTGSNTPELTSQTKAANLYLRNGTGSGGNTIDINGNVTTTKLWRPISPPSNYTADGNYMRNLLISTFNTLNRNVDWVNENGEIFPHILTPGLANDPDVNSARISSGLTPQQFLSRKIAENDNQSYRDIFMSLPKLSNAKYTYYITHGDPLNILDWTESRKLNHQINGQYYSTPDFYVRWPNNWRYWVSAWHGWQWAVECRHKEITAGDKLFSPFVSAGWEFDETQNIRPAQWLGFLKCVSILGAEFYYPGFFSLSAPWPDAKNWIWQAASVSYAQAVSSHYEEFFRNGTLVTGNVPASYVNPATPGYSIYAGDKRNLVVARKLNGISKWVISGSIQNNSNYGGTLKSDTCTINLGSGEDIKINIRRQGSTYIYDKTVSPPVFYQLDSWHDTTHYSRWSTDFEIEAENWDYAKNVTRKTFAIPANYTSFTTYISFTDKDTVEYDFQPRSVKTYYVFVRAKSSITDSTGFTLNLDGSNLKTVKCITDSTWRWYKFNTADSTQITYTNLSAQKHTLRFISLNNKLFIDKIVVTSNSNLYSAPYVACATGITPPDTTQIPVANFIANKTTICPDSTVTFTDLSTNTPTSWSWTLTGGTPSSSIVKNPTVTYSTIGTYSVSLTATNSAGSDGETKTNYISVNFCVIPPVANFTASQTNICSSSSITFTDQSTNNPTSWSWTFSGGSPSSSTSQNPVISYTTPGTYSVTLVASNSAGNNTLIRTGYIVVTSCVIAPVANFVANQTTICSGSTISFTDQSINAPTSWLWSFTGGTPTSSTSQNPTITYSTPGTYQVQLTATNSAGSDVEVKTNYVTISSCAVTPVANFTTSTNNICTGQSITFTDISINTPTSWSWTFTGGTPSSSILRNPTVIYNSVGTYSVTLTATNTAGSDGETKTNLINVSTCVIPPVANFTANNTVICVGDDVTFTNSSTNSPTNYNWVFTSGTPSSSTLTNPVINYTTAGLFDVSLQAINSAGNDSEIKTNYITVNVCSTTLEKPTLCVLSASRFYKVDFCWTQNGSVTSFEVQLIRIKDNYTETKILPPNVFKKSYYFLLYRREYKFRVRAEKNGTYSEWSEIIFTTK